MTPLFSILLLFPLLFVAQAKDTLSGSLYEAKRGRVFPVVVKHPGQRLERSGVVVVRRSLYGLTFKDPQIPQVYKKAVKKFFKRRLKGYTDLKAYRLQIENYQGSLWIEGIRMD